jgi:hypothetical protein
MHLASPLPHITDSRHHEVQDALLSHLFAFPVSQDNHRRGRHPGATAVKQLVGPQCLDDAEGQQGVSPDAIASSKC